MKATQNIRLLSFLVCIAICFSNCTTSKHLGEKQNLLTKNSIVQDGRKVRNKEVYALLKQKPNKKILGFIPIYLNIYNIAFDKNEDNLFKKISEPPTILNHRLARKSATQIELYYKNKGYFDAVVSFDIHKKKHKAKAVYSIHSGSAYKINEVKINHKDDSDLNKIIKKFLDETQIKKGKIYNFKSLENERSRIASKLQNQGYYQFNKEFIHFLADTNQISKKVNLDLVVKPFEKNEKGEILQESHKPGIIGLVNVHLETKNSNAVNDTIVLQGINFIYNTSKAPFNLKRLAEKIVLRAGLPYNKSYVDKSYQALSELKNFKKITFEFSPVNTDQDRDVLSVDIYLIPNKKIAYTVEVEATTNPELNEGISGSASLSHYNILKGAEHLQLTFKGSKNINFKDAKNIVDIRENGFIMNLTIPDLISPIKLNKILNKNSGTKTVFTASVTEQKRPEFTRNSITGSYTYKWKTKQNYQHKLSLFNLSYVNFQEDSADLSNISEYLIAKDYSSHLIPTSSYTLSFNNQNINKLKNHSFFRIHLESSGSILRNLADPLNFNQLRDDEGNPILQEDGSPTYILSLWNMENIFTQYVKTSLDYRYYWEIDEKNSLALRTMGGVIYAYGNTKEAPFHKKFVAGGANDLRGWQAFKRPPGTLITEDKPLHTGGIKLITSVEYRFNLIKKLKGAVFMDAGNIWEISANNSKDEAANFKWDRFLDEIAVDIGFGLRYDFKYFILRSDLGYAVREPYESKPWQWEKVKINDTQLNIGLGYPF